MGLLLEGEADCLNHQHNHRRHWPPIRRQSRAAAPYRASGLVLSAIPAVGATIRQRQLWSALLTSSIRSGRTAGFCASGGQKTTLNRPSGTHKVGGSFRGATAVRLGTRHGKSSAITVIRVSALVRRLRVAFLTFTGRRSRMTGLTETGCVLSMYDGRRRQACISTMTEGNRLNLRRRSTHQLRRPGRVQGLHNTVADIHTRLRSPPRCRRLDKQRPDRRYI
jgi:hypothetical protein